MKLSVLIPVLNEEATLEEIVARVQATPHEKELVLIDDGSEDRTPEIMAQLAEASEGIPQRHRLDPRQRAAGEDEPVGELADADEHDRQAQAADVLVGAQCHRQQRHQRTCDQPHHDGADQTDPGRGFARAGRLCLEGHGEAEEGARVHRALDAKV